MAMNLVIIAGYLMLMIAVGFSSSRRIRGLASFYVSDRSGSLPLIAGSLLATIVGASQTLGLAGLGYSKGLVGAWWMLVGALGLFILAISLARKVRSSGAYTLPELLKGFYGSQTIKVVASLLITIAWLGVIAAQMVAAGKIITEVWPLHIPASVIIMGTVFILYTALGGQYSVLKTDLIQFIIIVAGVLVCLAAGVKGAGGIYSMANSLPGAHLDFPVSEQFTLNDIIVFVLFVGSTYLVGPDMYSRLLSARSPRVAKMSALLASMTMIPLAFAITIIGMSARVIFPGIEPEKAFLHMIMNLLPAGMNGFVVAALLAAVMSTAATCLLTTSTTVVSDIIRPLAGNRLGEVESLLLSRAAVVVIGILSILIALHAKGIISSLLLAYTFYSGGFIIPVIFGFSARRLGLNSTGAILALVAGGCLALALKLSSHDDLLVICFPVSVVLLFAGSKFGKAGDGTGLGRRLNGPDIRPAWENRES